MPIISESKSFQTFRSEIQYLKQHLQVIDASLSNSGRWLAKYKTKSDKITKALGTVAKKYDTLNHPVSDFIRIFNYTRSKNAEFSIIELYNAFSVYMKSILTEMYKHNPIQIVGKAIGNPNFTYVELVKFGSFQKVEEEMISKVFRKLEDEKSTTKLLEKILNHTDIILPSLLKTNALMYLEMRHLFIHNNGKADEQFVKEYGSLISVKANAKLPTNFDTVSNAIQSVFNLIEFIDKELVNKKLVDKRH
ncbi:MAG: hypothetical protein J0L62_11120 [Bacteroidetes bacterium]|nr:hypothetical protein [Bacteroidota bacterium]